MELFGHGTIWPWDFLVMGLFGHGMIWPQDTLAIGHFKPYVYSIRDQPYMKSDGRGEGGSAKSDFISKGAVIKHR